MDFCCGSGRTLPRSEFLSWDRDDRDAALAWLIHDRQRCPSCRTRADEWDPEQGGRDDAYRTELHRCWGCAAIGEKEKDITEQMGAGVHVALLPETEGPREDPGEGVEPPPVRDPGEEVP